MRSGAILFFLFCLTTVPSKGQVVADINAGDVSLSVTVWKSEGRSSATVLLVPGWSGGPSDVLGLGKVLAAANIDAVVLSPRGWHESTGEASFLTTNTDMAAAMSWIRTSPDFPFNRERIFVAGQSWGGGMSLIYASQDSTVTGVISIAGTDHGPLVDRYKSDPEYAQALAGAVRRTTFPEGPIVADSDSLIAEMVENRSAVSVVDHAPALSNHSILILGGWEDVTTTIDGNLLPYYRALKEGGASDVTFLTYHTGHSFSNVREKVHTDIVEWINR